MEIESDLVQGVDLIKFLGSLNDKQVDEELAKLYLIQQNENQRQSMIKSQQNHLDETITQFYKRQLKNLFKKSGKIIKKTNKEKRISLDELITNEQLVFKSNYFIRDNKYCSIHTISELPLVLPEG
ncbi:hypothetical protein JIY74_27520 [Vibrio harveyi]|nr:hypothetical protein [Vibrio harveyi]